MTFNGSWGYMPISPDWRSVREVIGMPRTAAAGQGNLLLNIGPTPDGSMPPEAVERLEAVGRWVAQNGEAMYGHVDRAGRGQMDWMPTGQWTIKGNNAYFWCTHWPGEELVIGALRTEVEQASILSTGQVVDLEQTEYRLILKGLPKENPDDIAGVTVIKLACVGPPRQVLGAGCVVLEE